ncbi:MAG: hypothetical protein OXQ29_13915, partial [Rhodospirillaceae bacterium]|nr:hypothetical protein [Rhodospirillaceae bacterium]
LLSPYVWKTPRTHLEALREIIRALPAAPANVEPQDGIIEPDTESELESTAVELSDEAKTILREAARDDSDGLVRNVSTLNSEFIYVDDRQLISDQEPRTIARWMGGLQGLQRYDYIRAVGSGGERFDVTREGYKMADMMEIGIETHVIESQTGDLSDEAKAILREAVSGDGRIMNIRVLNGQNIQANGKLLIPPGQKARTVAYWVGGLEDLQRYEYIEDIGYNGEVFKVTIKGYDAADEMLGA